jgi:hypothetical protein
MSTVTPDLSDFKPDTQDMSDFKPDSPVESPIAPPPNAAPYSVTPESSADFVNRITGHPGYKPAPFTPLSVAKGTLNDLKTLTVGGIQATARGLAGGKPILGMPPPPAQTIQAGANVGVGMLLGGLEGEGISPTEGLNRVINKVPTSDPAFSAIRGAAQDTATPVEVGKLPIAKGNPYSGPRTPASMDVVQSTNHDLAGYHPESQTMTIQFKNGRVYQYRGVPQEIYDQYLQSESQGSFFANNIKGRYQTDFRGTVKPSAGSQVRHSLGR